MKPHSSKIKCGECGSFYGPKTWHSKSKYKRTIWRCNKKYVKKGEPCSTPHLYEDEIKDAFIESVNDLLSKKNHIMEDLKLVEEIFDTSQLEKDLENHIDNMNLLKDKIEQLIENNARTSQDQTKYLENYNDLVQGFNKEKKAYETLLTQIKDKESRKVQFDFFVKQLDTLEPLHEFDPMLWNLMLEVMIVNKDRTFEFIYAKGI